MRADVEYDFAPQNMICWISRGNISSLPNQDEIGLMPHCDWRCGCEMALFCLFIPLGVDDLHRRGFNFIQDEAAISCLGHGLTFGLDLGLDLSLGCGSGIFALADLAKKQGDIPGYAR